MKHSTMIRGLRSARLALTDFRRSLHESEVVRAGRGKGTVPRHVRSELRQLDGAIEAIATATALLTTTKGGTHARKTRRPAAR